VLGKYENFPVNIHFAESFLCTISSRQLQRKLVEKFCELNQKSFCFEDVAIPTVPDCTLIFEFGIAEDDGFNFLNEEEAERALGTVKDALRSMDFFVQYVTTRMAKKRSRL
jgi:hypothetical protein